MKKETSHTGSKNVKNNSAEQNAPPAKIGLSKSQKFALIGAVAVLVFVLGATLILGGQQAENGQEFSEFLYASNKSGILMDVRNSPSTAENAVVMQCGVNLITGGFFAQTQKDLLVYACDNSGCLSSLALANQSDADMNETLDSDGLVIPFDQALYEMRGRAYFHIMYSDEEKKEFHPTYVEVYVNSSSDASKCSLSLKSEQ